MSKRQLVAASSNPYFAVSASIQLGVTDIGYEEEGLVAVRESEQRGRCLMSDNASRGAFFALSVSLSLSLRLSLSLCLRGSARKANPGLRLQQYTAIPRLMHIICK